MIQAGKDLVVDVPWIGMSALCLCQERPLVFFSSICGLWHWCKRIGWSHIYLDIITGQQLLMVWLVGPSVELD